MSMNFNGGPLVSRTTGISSEEDKKNQEDIQQGMQTAFNRFRSALNPVLTESSQAREFERKVELDAESNLAQKICKLSISKGTREYSLEEYQNLHEHFLELGDIYVEKKAYPKAIALYNMSLRIAVEKLKLPSRVVTNIEWKILNAEQQFLNDVLKEKAPKLQHDVHQRQIKSYKDHLEKFRETTRQALKVAYDIIQKVKDERGTEEAEKKKVELIREIFKNISVEIKGFIKILLKDCFEILEKPPCGYAIVGLGSLAREEATPYSDFEFAILISDENEGGKNKEYFRNLTDFLHLKVINLGETIIPAMAIESLNPTHGRNTDFFFDDITPRGFAFDGAMPQACKTPHGKKDADGKVIFELIQTPDKMAAYHGKTPDGRYWFEVDPHLTFALANMVFLVGDEALVKNYQGKMWEVLNQPLDPKHTKELGEKHYLLGQYIALKLLKENSRMFDPNLDKYEDAGRLFDAKKDLYRIPNLIIDALGLFYGLKNSGNGNSYDKLKDLYLRNVLSINFFQKFEWVLMETMRFRLDVYLEYRSQKEQMNPLLKYFAEKSANAIEKDQKSNLDKQFKMNDSDFESLQKIYQVLIPLQDAISKLIHGDEDLLQNLHYEVSAFIQGKVFFRLLQYSKALESFQEFLKKHAEHNGQEHSIVVSIYNYAGAACGALGDPKKAVEYFKKALKIGKKINEPDFVVATTYNNLGLALHESGDEKKAVKYHKKALAIRIKLYGREHPIVAASYNNLGLALQTLGYTKYVIWCYGQVLLIQIKHYGLEHPAVAISYNNLGTAWQDFGDAKEAVKYHEQALAIRIKLYGLEHPIVAASYNNLGSAWQALGDAKKAIGYFEKALPIVIKLCGPEHFHVAGSYNNLGVAWQALGDAKKAIGYFEKALPIVIKFCGQEHFHVAVSYNNLAVAWRILGDAKKAVEYYDKALKILHSKYDSNRTILNQLSRDRNSALQFLQQQTKNQSETQLSNDCLVISLPAASKDYIRRLQFVLNESIVQIDKDERIVSFPVSWLRQLSDGAINELSRELKNTEIFSVYKRSG